MKTKIFVLVASIVLASARPERSLSDGDAHSGEDDKRSDPAPPPMPPPEDAGPSEPVDNDKASEDSDGPSAPAGIREDPPAGESRPPQPPMDGPSDSASGGEDAGMPPMDAYGPHHGPGGDPMGGASIGAPSADAPSSGQTPIDQVPPQMYADQSFQS